MSDADSVYSPVPSVFDSADEVQIIEPLPNAGPIHEEESMDHEVLLHALPQPYSREGADEAAGVGRTNERGSG